MSLRAMKRAVCFILAFLMLLGSAEPGTVLSYRAAAFEEASGETPLFDVSEEVREEAPPAAEAEETTEETLLVEGSGETPEEALPVEGFGETPEEALPVEGSGETPEEAPPVEGSGETPEEAPSVEGSGETPGEAPPVEGSGETPEEALPVEGSGETPEEALPVESSGETPEETPPVEGSGEDAAPPVIAEDGEAGEDAPDQERLIYFQPCESWTAGCSRFAAVVRTAEGERWIEAEDRDGDGRLEFRLPDTLTTFRFVRLSADQPLNDWDYVLDKTEELRLPEDQALDLYTLDAEGTRGAWSAAASTPLPREEAAEEPETEGEASETEDEETETEGEESETEGEEPETEDEASEAEDEASEAEDETSEPEDEETEAEGEASEESEDSVETEESEEAEESAEDEEALMMPRLSRGLRGTRDTGSAPGSTDTVSLRGSVRFNEGEGDGFTGLLRPKTFNQTLAVVPIYFIEDENGVEQKIEAPAWATQDLSSSSPCFIKIFAESDGTAEFEIDNIPRTVTVDGTEHVVAEYFVTVPNPQPFYYTQAMSTPTRDLRNEAGSVTVTGLTVWLSLLTGDIYLYSDVQPNDGEPRRFRWKVTFTRPSSFVVDAEKDEYSFTDVTFYYDDPRFSSYNGWVFVTGVPIGINYSIEQLPADDYRLGEGSTLTGTAETYAGFEVYHNCVNYPINMSVPFTVEWYDNNSVDRPKNYNEIFKLEVRKSGSTSEDDWEPFPTTGLDTLYGISKAPEVTLGLDGYSYTGLPGADMEGNVLEYRIVCDPPENYTVDKTSFFWEDSAADRHFVLHHCHDFEATVEWKDDGNAQNLRPSESSALTNLRLYSRKSDGTLTDITGDRSSWRWKKSGNTWKLTVPNLPTYTNDNHEIEYFLVHGTDVLTEGTETVTPAQYNTGVDGTVYTAYYNNGTGSYASDEERCHAKGTITMLLNSVSTFSADIEWKDDEETETVKARPKTIVTLWRYAKNEGLDAAYEKEDASMVVFTDTDGVERPLEFTLPEGSGDAKLETKWDSASSAYKVFFTVYDIDGKVVSTESKTVTLPGHDGAGRKYTYFLRETLTGVNKNNYRVVYSEGGSVFKEGVPDNGTVTNIRQEKALVTVYKVWRNPEGLSDIAGAEVRLALYSQAQGAGSEEALLVYSSDEGSYQILSDTALTAAQTVSGFTETVPTAQMSYYVNLYDSNGRLFDLSDMSKTRLVETVTLTTGGRYYQKNSILKSETITREDGSTYTQEYYSIKLGSEDNDDAPVYSTMTALLEEGTTVDGLKRYLYNQVNTITATREYDLIKTWSLNGTYAYVKDYIEAVEMVVKRCRLDKLGTSSPGWEVVGTEYVYKIPGSDPDLWKKTLQNLPKYDSEGNVYYYYATETGFLVKDGVTLPKSQVLESPTTSTKTVNGVDKVFLSVSEADAKYGWNQSYFRDETQTTVDNHDIIGSGYFTINKSWKDNNDVYRSENGVNVGRPSVIIRVYDREALHTAVSAHTQTETVNWTALDIEVSPVATYALTKDNNYTVYAYYRELCGGDESKARTKSLGDYVAVEYCLGDPTAPYAYDSQTAASYTYGQLKALATDEDLASASGTAAYDAAKDSADRSYNVTNIRSKTEDTFYFRNVRTGTTKLILTKQWNDEQNRDGLRPNSITFKLYRDSVPCGDFTGVTFTCTIPEVTVVPDTNEDDEYTGTFTATYDLSRGANKDGLWTITVSDLPMFSGESGMLYAYNVDEQNNIPALTGSGDVYYVQSGGVVSSALTGTTQSFNIALTNTVVGTTSHTAYKYWRDVSVPRDQRPDLIFTLYRYVKSEVIPHFTTEPTWEELYAWYNTLDADAKTATGYDKVTNHNDPIWTPGDGTAIGASGQVYDWRLDINELPRFDGLGREYGYVLQERMRNEGVTVRGTYTGVSARIGEVDEFTNTIHAPLTVSGRKIWKGHETFTLTMADLPDPTITLYRMTESTYNSDSNESGLTYSGKRDLNSLEDTEISTAESKGEIVEVDVLHLTGTDKNSYAFPTASSTFAVEGGMLPKYNEMGERYVYLMRETLSDRDPDDPDVTDEIVNPEELYAKTSATGTLTNELKTGINRRRITVSKSWVRDGVGEDINKYPSVTFELYRYVVNDSAADKGLSTAILYETRKVSASDFLTESGTPTTHEIVFDNLLVYSPSGKYQYGYYVKEKSVKGYDILLSSDAGFPVASSVGVADAKNLAFTNTDGWKTSAGVQNNLYARNTYTPKAMEITLKGRKVWSDWKNEAGLRPAGVTVTLKRSTPAEAGESNSIDSHPITLTEWNGTDAKPTEPWIRWIKLNAGYDDLGRELWTYEIGGLPRYAPNGIEYIYTITEQNTDDYKNSGTVSTEGAPFSEDDGIFNLSDGNHDLTNELTASYRFRKYWLDGSNVYNLRPDSITVVLQYSADGGSTWQDMSYSDSFQLTGKPGGGLDGRWFAYTSTIDDAIHKDALAVELTVSDAVPNTGNNTWQYIFTNLPARRLVGTEVKTLKYRCVEVKVGKMEVVKELGSSKSPALPVLGEEYSVGAYKAEYRKITDDVTEVQNSLDSSSLRVEKVWEGDQNDLYQTRPDSLTFKLQRRGYDASSGSLSVWSDVMIPGSGDTKVPYTFTVTKADGWVRELENLPVSGTDENGVDFYQMEFRAVELHDPDTDTTVLGARNYVDQMDYSSDATDGHSFDPTSSGAKNTSTIRNELMTLDETRVVDKVWYASDNAADPDFKATFELQYRLKGSTGNWNSYSPALTQTLSKAVNGESHTTVGWSDFPQYDRAGNELEYRIIEWPIAGYITIPVETTSTGDVGAGEGEDEGDGVDLDAFFSIGPSPFSLPGGTSSGAGSGNRGVETQSRGTSYSITRYLFTNVKLQDYTVNKTWTKPGLDANGVAYIPDNGGSFTSTFVLQQKIGDGAWTVCTPSETDESGTQILTGDASYTWHNLPQYTDSGKEISYRAVETHINGNAISGTGGSTDGNYIVTYDYDGTTENKTDPAFDDTKTDSVNRLVYGFVDLSKEAAYLSPAVAALGGKLSGVEFKLLDASGNDYATKIYTDSEGRLTLYMDSDGNLTPNARGKYGAEQRYLIPGSYTLVEVSTPHSYSRWDRGVNFNVGLTGGTTDTGEHGTAWISTVPDGTGSGKLVPTVSYLAPTASTHSFGDGCAPPTESYTGYDAYNLESRGVIEFTKTGPGGAALDTHSGSLGEDAAYFGVYTDSDCTNQVAGMSASNGVSFVLTDRAQDGTTALTIPNNSAGIPYLRGYGSGFTLLSGVYYVRELVAPAGYKLDTTVRTVTIPKLDTTALDTDLSGVYSDNKGKFGSTTDYQWPNSPNSVTIYKLDQFGRNVTLKSGGWLELRFDSGTFPTGESTIRLYQSATTPATKTDGTTQVGNESGKWSISYDAATAAWTITGLFDAGKSYTLSEHADAVPDNNVLAKPIPFTIGADGRMSVSNADTMIPTGSVTTAKGAIDETNGRNDYKNYYQPGTDNNLVVLRDVARFRKNVAVLKVTAGTTTPIPNISFQLYHGLPSDASPALVTETVLTTDENGIIDLSELPDTVTNSITNAPLKNGLDLGNYFFRELERGASDGYRLAGDIPFSIVAVASTSTDYEDYAKVVFASTSTKRSAVTQTESAKPDRGTVANSPVSGKSLNLTKKDADGTTPLSGARFRLEYVMPHMKQASSLATAVLATFAFFPFLSVMR